MISIRQTANNICKFNIYILNILDNFGAGGCRLNKKEVPNYCRNFISSFRPVCIEPASKRV